MRRPAAALILCLQDEPCTDRRGAEVSEGVEAEEGEVSQDAMQSIGR